MKCKECNKEMENRVIKNKYNKNVEINTCYDCKIQTARCEDYERTYRWDVPFEETGIKLDDEPYKLKTEKCPKCTEEMVLSFGMLLCPKCGNIKTF